METIEDESLHEEKINCTNCGADLKFKPGTDSIVCDYCGAVNEISKSDEQIEELDFNSFIEKQGVEKKHAVESYVTCTNCGASSTLEPNVTAANCPYCTTPLMVEQCHEEEIIQPKSLLPFKIDKPQAVKEFKTWLHKSWFTPNKLKKASVELNQFKGIYTPYWTYDLDSVTDYSGQRGEYYYVTESYTAIENGETVTKTRRVRKTKWYFASGVVNNFFDDILINASNSLPKKYIEKLEPWDLENLIPFNKDYLKGFTTEKYQVELEEGFKIAELNIVPDVKSTIRRDIGGDTQRITSYNINYNNITFKHLLLPVYVCAYNFDGKLYQLLINARTGEVQGQRPYSKWKIALAVLAGIVVVAGIIFLVKNR